jgi:hypothetical protein
MRSDSQSNPDYRVPHRGEACDLRCWGEDRWEGCAGLNVRFGKLRAVVTGDTYEDPRNNRCGGTQTRADAWHGKCRNPAQLVTNRLNSRRLREFTIRLKGML